MNISENRKISIKDYAEKYHVSVQSVYAKIRRRKNELDGHTLKRGGTTFLYEYAQELLKPAEGNSMLMNKNVALKKELSEAKAEAEKINPKRRSTRQKRSDTRDRRRAYHKTV